ncbi:hypothetical protein EV182_005209 [Spiromyces aspiralis]|uniref:Uncharacterized protein n=1 Tax=Spiromyces aspiralis TaxID=68401 RepID=A0ACC1HQ65_9FUNG|nr:hypothetical protein EV182_005209 [Spiromyces aspiralis]
MYDPKLDAKTEEWVDKVKFKDDLLLAADELSSGAVKGRRKGSQVLACPGCFTQICWNSQPHVKYHGQYRAMFVENCQVDEGKRLYYPRESATAQPVRRTVGPDGGASTGSAEEELRQESDVYRPVKCDECGTTVGVVDEEEVYHLFHVLPEL